MKSDRLRRDAEAERYEADIALAWANDPSQSRLLRELYLTAHRDHILHAEALEAEARWWASGWRRFVP